MEIALYLIPVDLGHQPEGGIYSPAQLQVIHSIHHFVAENASTARRMLKKCGYPHALQQTEIIEFNEHSRNETETMAEIKALLQRGLPIGLMSEAGMPCVADPGHEVVRMAHRMGIKVVPLHGPSSIIQSLAASGFTGQQFIFHGYLPVKTDVRRSKLTAIARQLKQDQYTQVFMEVPYRTNSLLRDIVSIMPDNIELSVAIELTTPDELIKTQNVGQWKKSLPDLHKKRCVFILSA